MIIRTTQLIMIIMIINITKYKKNPKRKHHLVNPKLVDILLNLIYKHFPEDNKFHTIFNRKNKVSYSYIPNIKSAINLRNRKILDPCLNIQSRT